MSQLTDLCISLAAYGLPGALLDLPEDPLDSSTWEQLFTTATDQGIDGLLADAVMRGALVTGEAQASAIRDSHVEAMSSCLLLESRLLVVLAEFDRAGIPVAVIRGTATAHLDYPDPALRPFRDIDLLVPPRLVERSGPVLTAAGFNQAGSPPLAGKWDASGLGFITEDRLEVDLYDHLVAGPLTTTMAAGELWNDLSTFELAGAPVLTLNPEARLIAACLQAVVGAAPRLIGWRDVLQLTLGGLIDVDRLRSLADRWGVRGIVAAAIKQAWEAFSLADSVALSTWARRYRPRLEEVSLLGAYREPAVLYRQRRRMPRWLLSLRKEAAWR